MVPPYALHSNRLILWISVWQARFTAYQQEKVALSKKVTGLSNVQNVRLGGLIAVLSGRDPYDFILDGLLDDGSVQRKGNKLEITDKGMQKDRLITLAGLMFEKNNLHQT